MKARQSRHLQPPSPHVVHSPTVSTGHPYCFLLHILWPSPSSSPFITLPRLLPRHPQALWGQLRAECVLNVNPPKLILINKWGSGTSLPEIKYPCVVRRSEGGQDSTMRGKGHSTGAEWTVTWCPHEVGLTHTCLSHSGLYLFKGSTSSCRFGAWTSSRPSVVRKEILTCESNSPDCCEPLSPFLSHPQFSCNSTGGL